MAAPSIVSSIGSNGSSTSHVISLPASLVAGNLLVIILRTAGAGAITWPDASWHELFDDSPDDADDQISAAWHVVTGSEGSTITCTGGNSKHAAIAYQISGAIDPATQPPEFQRTSNPAGSNNTPDSPSISPTGGSKDYLILSVATMDNESTMPPTYPTNYALANSRVYGDTGTSGAAGNNCRVVGSGRQVTAASEDPGAYTIDTVSWWTAITFAIHPAASYSVYTPTVSLPATSGIVGGRVVQGKPPASVPSSAGVAGTYAKQAVRTIAGAIPASAGVAATWSKQAVLTVAGSVAASAGVAATYSGPAVIYRPAAEVGGTGVVVASVALVAAPPAAIAGVAGVAAPAALIAAPPGIVPGVADVAVTVSAVAVPRPVLGGTVGISATITAVGRPSAGIPASSGVAAGTAATGAPPAAIPGVVGVEAAVAFVAAPPATVSASAGIAATVSAQTSAGVTGDLPAQAGVAAGVSFIAAPGAAVGATAGVLGVRSTVTLPSAAVAATGGVAGLTRVISAPPAAVPGASGVVAGASAVMAPGASIPASAGIDGHAAFTTPGHEVGDLRATAGITGAWAAVLVPRASVAATAEVAGSVAAIATPPVGIAAVAEVSAEFSFTEGVPGQPVTYTWDGLVAAHAGIAAASSGPVLVPPAPLPTGGRIARPLARPPRAPKAPRRRRLATAPAEIRIPRAQVTAGVRYYGAPRIHPAVVAFAAPRVHAVTEWEDGLLEEEDAMLLSGTVL